METYQDEAEVRLEKLRALETAGVPTYPQVVSRTHTVAAALADFDNLQSATTPITIVGRLLSVRMHGGSAFADLQDGSGRMQVLFRRNIVGENFYEQLKTNIDHGDFLELTGLMMVTKVGERTLEAQAARLIVKSLLPLPDKFHGLQDVELRYRKRYLDLIANEDAWRIAQLRPQIVRAIRNFLETRGFVEVETPILQEQAGGALAKPFVTHHNALNTDLYLRIAPELYLKRLVVGGFEKVFEVARCFRNEGIDHAHNPEFTQVEFYWAYATYEDLMKLSEELIGELVNLAHGKNIFMYRGEEYNFSAPFPRLTMRDAVLNEIGVDIDEVRDEKKLRALIIDKNFKDVDLAGCVGYAEVLDELYKRTVRPRLKGPVFLTDYPIEMVPLAKRCDHDPSKAAIVQLVVAGVELLKGYNELNDPLDQEARFLEQMRLRDAGSSEAMEIDTDFIDALKQGMPPTAGWGMGVDRLLQVLVDAPNLKEVILFPTLRPQNQSQPE